MAEEITKNENAEKSELYREILAIVKENPKGIEENTILRLLAKKKFNIEGLIPSEKASEVEAFGKKAQICLLDLTMGFGKLKVHKLDKKFFMNESEEVKTDLFQDIKNIYSRNIEFAEYQAYDFFPCWIIGTYIFQAFESYPYVYLHAPKRSGKSKTLTLTSKLARNSVLSVNISQASVYRIIQEEEPSLFIDEADYLSKEERAELYKILNAGYKKGAYVYRCENVGKKIEIRKWNVYCPKMLASVDELKEQFIDRCITFHLLRSRNKEIANTSIKENVDDKGIKWEAWRSEIEKYAFQLKPRILENFEELDKDKSMEEIIGRDRELWLPILAIGRTLNADVFSNLINLALEIVGRTKEQEKETLENAIITELLEIVNEDSWIYSNDIHNRLKLKPEWEWLNSRTSGKVMKRLNFQLKHSSKGSMYLVKLQDLKELARRYSVDVNDKSEVSDKSDENEKDEPSE